MRNLDRFAGLSLGFVLDRVFADPRRCHPVAAFGGVAARVEQVMYADSRVRGAAYAGGLAATTVGLGTLVERVSRRHPILRMFTTAIAAWVVLGGRSLEREACACADLLADGDLAGARMRLTHLVGRDTGDLDENEIARAVIESVAENTSDAVVAPVVWGAVAGVPGLLGHRAVNTLDAMVGHHDSRYENFGWAAARLDDVANIAGARLGGLLTVAVAASPQAWTAWRHDAWAHPSPNAGVVEAAFAGALGVQLGGTNSYGGRVEHRALLGSGRDAVRGDIGRAVTLARRVDQAAVLMPWLVVVACATGHAFRRRLTRRSQRS